jgi:hypothetical protein
MAYTAPSITASGTTFAQLVAGGVSGHLERLITANLAASTAPSAAATATATGGGSTGGSLAAGTYYFVFTELDGVGETTASPQGSQLTVAAGNIPQFSFPSLQAGNTARNLYLGAAGGPSGGPYALYATGITTTTYNASAAAPSSTYAVKPPTANSTGLTFVDAGGQTINIPLQLIRYAKTNQLQKVWNYLHEVVNEFTRGEPVAFGAVMTKLRHAQTAFAMFSTLCSEVGTLIDANPGHFGTSQLPIGTIRTVRTQP